MNNLPHRQVEGTIRMDATPRLPRRLQSDSERSVEYGDSHGRFSPPMSCSVSALISMAREYYTMQLEENGRSNIIYNPPFIRFASTIDGALSSSGLMPTQNTWWPQNIIHL